MIDHHPGEGTQPDYAGSQLDKIRTETPGKITLWRVSYAQAIDHATVRTFRVPDVGRVRVEIGDEVYREIATGRFEHAYPAYCVSIGAQVIMSGADWGVPVARRTDDVDAMLNLLRWVAHEVRHDSIEQWVSTRQEVRAAITAPDAGDPFAIARAGYRGELG